MSEDQSMQQIILDTAQKIFSDLCDKNMLDRAESGEFSQTLWQQVVETGFHQLGGAHSGTDWADLYAFLAECGRHAVPLPLAEALLANRWCAAQQDGLQPTADGAVVSIGVVEGDEIVDVPWGRRADRVVGLVPGETHALVIDMPNVVRQGINMAGEPRDVVACVGLAGDSPVNLEIGEHGEAYLALSRANLMAGALQNILDLGLQFATEREQFGRPISKFQAIQHSLAVVAAETAAARRAADSAVDAIGTDRFVVEVAAAKARVGDAVTVVAEQVHQVHGAMGFTHEHRLHHFTRRAWAWRDEYGNESYWQRVLGSHIASLGADQAWNFIATRG